MNGTEYDLLVERIEQQLQTESPMIEWHVLRASEIIMRMAISFPDGFTHVVVETSITINDTRFRAESKTAVEFVERPYFVEQLRHQTSHKIATLLFGV